VHAPAAEEAFMAAGRGVRRLAVMHNDFIVVGPENDRARVATAASATEAFRRIGEARTPFISRGDDSGTHKKEQSLWKSAGLVPGPGDSWYAEIGQGMGEALTVASERQAYTLSDRGTFLFQHDGLQLKILHEGDSVLFNAYSVITVAGARNSSGADLFANWIVGSDAQKLIAGYGADRFGRALFVPDARSTR
jgi:tungstate transport system substrate-binding protein